MDWFEPVEHLVRNRHGSLLLTLLVLAASPLVVWAGVRLDRPAPPAEVVAPAGPTEPATSPPGPDVDATTTNRAPLGPRASFGGRPSSGLVVTDAHGPGPCHPDYSGCLPIVADIDCANSGGDGPVLLTGRVLVTGDDVYDLDANGDLIACFDGDAVGGTG